MQITSETDGRWGPAWQRPSHAHVSVRPIGHRSTRRDGLESNPTTALPALPRAGRLAGGSGSGPSPVPAGALGTGWFLRLRCCHDVTAHRAEHAVAWPCAAHACWPRPLLAVATLLALRLFPSEQLQHANMQLGTAVEPCMPSLSFAR
jgi:hypothetical protein